MDAFVDSVLSHLEVVESAVGCCGVVAGVRAVWYLYQAAAEVLAQEPTSKEAESEVLSSGEKLLGKIKREDLQSVGVLGYGGFGVVELCEHKGTGETYALKSISKGYIIEIGMQKIVLHEKEVLMMIQSPFICRLCETYNTSETLEFLLEPCLGGDLNATFCKMNFYGSVEHCTFYTAGTVLALEYLHMRKIIYQDLKPENILLTAAGQMKLADLGAASFAPSGCTFPTSGTPVYFAPEMLKRKGHTNAVDWWQLGCLAFELMCGHPPFESEDRKQLKAKIRKGLCRESLCRESLPACCADFILSLVQQDPRDRLAMRPGGIANVKDHNWFSKIDWGLMQQVKLPPPYVPVVNNKLDLRNFEVCAADAPKRVQYIDPGTGWDTGFATYA